MIKPHAPPGRRLYAIGDIHGRLDLLERLMFTIRKDNARREPASTTIVVLGDIIDRGPQSAEIVRRFQRYTEANDRFIVLRGNHEEMMLQSLSGDLRALQAWMRFGGDETLRSWGVPVDQLASRPPREMAAAAARAVSPAELDWLAARPFSYRAGDYLFVHAGVRPGVALSEQDPQDLLWVSRDFTDSEADHGAVVVHGHTIEEDGPVFRSNRIGLDTGAYRSGRLTALGLEDDDQWTLSAILNRGADREQPVEAWAS